MARRPKKHTGGTPHVLSLFSGCGGFDLGFKNEGFHIDAALDIDSTAIDNYKTNVSPHGLVWDLAEGTLPQHFDNIDICLAGSPCQGFSTIGKRVITDPRNSLLLATGRIATALRPKVVVAENVPGVLSGDHRTYWERLEEILRGQNYRVATVLIRATAFGVPQLRKRVFMLAWNTGVDMDFSCDITNNIAGGATLSSALSDLHAGAANHQPKSLQPDSIDYAISRRIARGQKLCDVRGGDASIHTWDIPEVFGRTTSSQKKLLQKIMRLRRQLRVRDNGDADPVPIDVLVREMGVRAINDIATLEKRGYLRVNTETVDLRHTFNGKYRRLSPDEPSLTVDTNFGNPKYFLHPHEHRGFTVREAARIQGFPDDYVFNGPEREQFRMIGNAVPPPVGSGLARLVRALLG